MEVVLACAIPTLTHTPVVSKDPLSIAFSATEHNRASALIGPHYISWFKYL